MSVSKEKVTKEDLDALKRATAKLNATVARYEGVLKDARKIAGLKKKLSK